MGLKVWLPLNGNLNNQGLSNITVTNNGATIDNNGKIGKCYNFSNQYLSIPAPLNSSATNFTICAWVYVSSLANSYGPIYNSRTSGSGGGIVLWMVSSGFRMDDGAEWDLSYSYPTNTWIHICYTRDPSKKKLYLNGTLIGEANSGNLSGINTTAYIAKDLIAPSSYYLNGKLNDVRIYDHCLTSQEVKEVSKGLVIHYPLDDGNVTNIAYDCSGYCNNGTITGTLTASTDTPRYDKCTNFQSNSCITTNNSINGKVSIITVSAWAKRDSWTGDWRIISCTQDGGWTIYPYNDKICWLPKISGEYRYIYSLLSLSQISAKWHHFVATWDGNNAKLYIDGELLNTVTVSNGELQYYTSNAIFIGAEAASDLTTTQGSYFNGLISDVRIYATALSADDIKELYNTAAFVDNHGNVECFQAYEDSDSQVMKTGQVKTGEFKEVSKNLFNKDEVAFNSCNYGSVPNAFNMISYTGKCTPAKSIPIKPNTWYVLSYDETTVTINLQAFNTTWWDITGKVKVAEDTSGGSLGFYNKVKLKSPANAYFVSFSNFGALSDANLLILVNSLQLEEGEAFTSYEPHFIDVAAVYNNKIECNQLIEI